MLFLFALLIALAVLAPAAFQEQPQAAAPRDLPYKVGSPLESKDYGYIVPAVRWPAGKDGVAVIFVCWENYGPALDREHKLVQDAVTGGWQKYAKIEFRGWGQCSKKSAGIRIFVHDDDDDSPHTKGLGRGLDGVNQGMVLNFTFNNWSQPCQATPEKRDLCIKSIAMHEFGHALGFAHEQNRPDKPGECRQPPQGPSGGAIMLTPYDEHSIMNYCNSKYNNDGQLSQWDIAALQKVYGGR